MKLALPRLLPADVLGKKYPPLLYHIALIIDLDLCRTFRHNQNLQLVVPVAADPLPKLWIRLKFMYHQREHCISMRTLLPQNFNICSHSNQPALP